MHNLRQQDFTSLQSRHVKITTEFAFAFFFFLSFMSLAVTAGQLAMSTYVTVCATSVLSPWQHNIVAYKACKPLQVFIFACESITARPPPASSEVNNPNTDLK